MNVAWIVVSLVGSFAVSWWATGRVRDYAIARRILDIPNERSSHVVATPRGGGLAIAIVLLVALPLAQYAAGAVWLPIWGLAAGGALVAGVGFIDDRGHLPPIWRLVGHAVAAGCVLASIDGPPPVTVFGFDLSSHWIGGVLTALYVVWIVNLTNFMDGIDAIAALEVITTSLCGMTLCLIAAPASDEWLVPALVASAAGGFLVWNWPPARVFLGDAGSGLLGLLLAAMALRFGWIAPALFWSWTILLGVFVVDATVTLLRRLARGERVYEAHRSHAYQRVARRVGGHRPVALGVAAINVLWLFPIAALVAAGVVDGFGGLAFAYIPLAVSASVVNDASNASEPAR